MIPTVIISVTVIILATVFFVGARFAYGVAFCKRGDGVADPYRGLDRESFLPYAEGVRASIDRLISLPYEEIKIKSHDGLTLFARYYHVADGAPIELEMHGYRSTPLKDFSGGGCAALDRGHNLLLVDQRAHGKSGGRTISFGINERHDCARWAKYLYDRFGADVPVILVGISMGAATVLMASGTDLPENVVCVIADCPYSTPKDIIIKVSYGMGLPGRLVFPIVRAAARIYGGFGVTSDSPIAAVGRATLPILLIHGESDGFVPCEMSREIYKAIPHSKKRLVTVPGADHGISFLVDTELYLNEVDEFTKSAIEEWKKRKVK